MHERSVGENGKLMTLPVCGFSLAFCAYLSVPGLFCFVYSFIIGAMLLVDSRAPSYAQGHLPAVRSRSVSYSLVVDLLLQ